MSKDELRDAYVDLCIDLGYAGNTGPNGDWGDQYEVNHSDDHFANPCDIQTEPIVMIERSRYGQVWVTLHATIEDACKANSNQEYAEDWQYPEIIDLETGQHYAVEYRAVAVEVVA